jgi:hypothetical protein
MTRALAVVAAEGVEACAYADRPRATRLLAELAAAVDLGHAAARSVCNLYEDARVGVANGDFDAARALFQALRTV